MLLEAAKAYAVAKAGCDVQYVPHGATWLNGGRYDDDRSLWEREKSVSDGRAKNQGTIERLMERFS